MAFLGSRNTSLYDCSFIDVQGDSNTYNITGAISVTKSYEPGLLALLKVISSGAIYDSEERYPPPRCHPGTRAEILQNMVNWVNNEGLEEKRRGVLWLHGPAGAGKSAIAQTICERCAEQGDLAASFFFSRGRRDASSQLFPTIAFQLAMSIPGHRANVESAIESNLLTIHTSMRVQLQKLIVEVFRPGLLDADSVRSSPKKSPSLVVIDGLDECEGNDAQSQILTLISDVVSAKSTPLRFIIISRPEPHIRHAFNATSLQEVTFPLTLYNDHRSLDDVRAYLTSEFERMRHSQRHCATFLRNPGPFPSQEDLNLLVRRSDGYFIYAATIVRYVDEEYFSPVQRLKAALNASPLHSGPFDELNRVYQQVLSTSRDVAVLKKVLGFILTPRSTRILQTGSFITRVLHLEPDQLSITLRGLHSILRYDPLEDTYSPFHASLQDFIFDPSRAGKFYIDQQQNHAIIAHAYVESLKTWRRLPTSPNLGWKGILYDILFHLYKATACREDTVTALATTDVNFWYHHFNTMYPPNDWSAKPDAGFFQWLSQAIHVFQTHTLPSRLLIPHFVALRQTALRCAFAWLSGFEKGPWENLSSSAENALRYFKEWYISRYRSRRIPRVFGYPPIEYQSEEFTEDLGRIEMDIRHNIPITHAYLAIQCMQIFQSTSGVLSLSTYWIRAYIYSRIFWAAHVSRSRPGDVEVLFQLRHVQDHFQDAHLQHFRRILPVDTFKALEANKGGDIQQQLLKDPKRWVNRVLDKFDSGGRHEEQFPFSLAGLLTQFGKSDGMNARLVLEWLKKMDEPPSDLVTRWEAECRQAVYPHYGESNVGHVADNGPADAWEYVALGLGSEIQGWVFRPALTKARRVSEGEEKYVADDILYHVLPLVEPGVT